MGEINADSKQPKSREEFEEFLRQLATDARQDPGSWSNTSIEQYLEATSAWLGDMDGYFASINEPIPKEASWQLFAQMLLAGRVYE